MKLQAYNNDTELKEKFVKEIKWHQDQDKFLKGTYSQGTGANFKGCAVGCSIKSLNKLNGTRLQCGNHKAYEKYLGLPEWLARLEDTIFEGLPDKESAKWPLQFSEAIPVGADLEPVKYQFAIYLMKENLARVKKLDIPDDLKKQVSDSIKGSIKVNKVALDTGVWDESAAESASRSARSAAWSAESAARSARSAAWSAESAARSAWSAARSAWSAESAARSAARSAAESAARSAARSAESAAWSAARSAWSAESAARSAAWSAESAARSAARSAWSAESAARSAAWSAESAARSAARSAESAAYIKHSKKLLQLLKAAERKV